METPDPVDSYDYTYSDDYYVYVAPPEASENFICYSETINFFLQCIAILVSIFHVVVLLQKSVRAASIFIIMAGICVSDILNFSIDLCLDGAWFPKIYKISTIDCLREDYTIFNLTYEFLKGILNSTRPIPVFLAIFMENIRLLTLMFPLRPWSQKLTSRKVTVFQIMFIVVFWIAYYFWNWCFLSSLWYPNNLCNDTELRMYSKNVTEYVIALPTRISDLVETRESMEHWVRIIPTIFYPILTAQLIHELKVINKQRKSKHFHEDHEHDNLPKLIFFMTISFMLSEGVDGVRTMIMVGMYNWKDEFPVVRKVLLSSHNIVKTLRCLNVISHPFICYAMSTQYRNTVKRMCGCKVATVKITPKAELRNNTSRSSLGSTSRTIRP
ncbi:hypothetical protein CRE_13009 [Caenorhabditis remanei]|uniref:G-protein coupled receptors family 1 profile domain-containing protein n=1 Tax=Caenorhabditis remanei TaxID=31234 RepID=E3N176_CAERE|nr:hypothetical protein CRE_13009 [Caenorhabditis remanei]